MNEIKANENEINEIDVNSYYPQDDLSPMTRFKSAKINQKTGK